MKTYSDIRKTKVNEAENVNGKYVVGKSSKFITSKGDVYHLDAGHELEISGKNKDGDYIGKTRTMGKDIEILLNDADIENLERVNEEEVAETIKHEGDKWNVYSKSGKKLGSHDTEKEAKAQLAAVEISKHSNEGVELDTKGLSPLKSDPKEGDSVKVLTISSKGYDDAKVTKAMGDGKFEVETIGGDKFIKAVRDLYEEGIDEVVDLDIKNFLVGDATGYFAPKIEELDKLSKDQLFDKLNKINDAMYKAQVGNRERELDELNSVGKFIRAYMNQKHGTEFNEELDLSEDTLEEAVPLSEFVSNKNKFKPINESKNLDEPEILPTFEQFQQQQVVTDEGDFREGAIVKIIKKGTYKGKNGVINKVSHDGNQYEVDLRDDKGNVIGSDWFTAKELKPIQNLLEEKGEIQVDKGKGLYFISDPDFSDNLESDIQKAGYKYERDGDQFFFPDNEENDLISDKNLESNLFGRFWIKESGEDAGILGNQVDQSKRTTGDDPHTDIGDTSEEGISLKKLADEIISSAKKEKLLISKEFIQNFMDKKDISAGYDDLVKFIKNKGEKVFEGYVSDHWINAHVPVKSTKSLLDILKKMQLSYTKGVSEKPGYDFFGIEVLDDQDRKDIEPVLKKLSAIQEGIDDEIDWNLTHGKGTKVKIAKGKHKGEEGEVEKFVSKDEIHVKLPSGETVKFGKNDMDILDEAAGDMVESANEGVETVTTMDDLGDWIKKSDQEIIDRFIRAGSYRGKRDGDETIIRDGSREIKVLWSKEKGKVVPLIMKKESLDEGIGKEQIDQLQKWQKLLNNSKIVGDSLKYQDFTITPNFDTKGTYTVENPATVLDFHASTKTVEQILDLREIDPEIDEGVEDTEDSMNEARKNANVVHWDYYDLKPKKIELVRNNWREILKAIGKVFSGRVKNVNTSSIYDDYVSFNFELEDIVLNDDAKLLQHAITPLINKFGWNGSSVHVYDTQGEWNIAITLSPRIVTTGGGGIHPANLREENFEVGKTYRLDSPQTGSTMTFTINKIDGDNVHITDTLGKKNVLSLKKMMGDKRLKLAEANDVVKDKTGKKLSVGDVVKNKKGEEFQVVANQRTAKIYLIKYPYKSLVDALKNKIDAKDIDWNEYTFSKPFSDTEGGFFNEAADYEPQEKDFMRIEDTEGLDETILQKVVDFLKDNPNPDDEQVHAFADEIGVEHNEVEKYFYHLASKLVSTPDNGEIINEATETDVEEIKHIIDTQIAGVDSNDIEVALDRDGNIHIDTSKRSKNFDDIVKILKDRYFVVDTSNKPDLLVVEGKMLNEAGSRMLGGEIDEGGQAMTLDQAKKEAEKISKEEGVAQHVNQISDGKYEVSDWYDAENTVASYNNGRLNEASKEEWSKILGGGIFYRYLSKDEYENLKKHYNIPDDKSVFTHTDGDTSVEIHKTKDAYDVTTNNREMTSKIDSIAKGDVSEYASVSNIKVGSIIRDNAGEEFEVMNTDNKGAILKDDEGENIFLPWKAISKALDIVIKEEGEYIQEGISVGDRVKVTAPGDHEGHSGEVTADKGEEGYEVRMGEGETEHFGVFKADELQKEEVISEDGKPITFRVKDMDRIADLTGYLDTEGIDYSIDDDVITLTDPEKGRDAMLHLSGMAEVEVIESVDEQEEQEEEEQPEDTNESVRLDENKKMGKGITRDKIVEYILQNQHKVIIEEHQLDEEELKARTDEELGLMYSTIQSTLKEFGEGEPDPQPTNETRQEKMDHILQMQDDPLFQAIEDFPIYEEELWEMSDTDLNKLYEKLRNIESPQVTS